MKLKQLSVFIENRNGRLGQVCKVLSDAGLDIVTLTLADTSEFGILRLILRDWKSAKDVLEKAGFTVNVVDVMAVEVADEPGGLEKILNVAESNELSVEYMYAFADHLNDKAVLVLRFDDVPKACEIMSDSGLNILCSTDFYAEV